MIPNPYASMAAFTAISLISIPLILPNYERDPYYRSEHIGNMEIAYHLKHSTPPGSSVAAFYAGIPFYFSERRGVDLLGKTDRHVARLPAVPGIQKPGHNKFDFDYSIGVLRPDYVVALKIPIDEDQQRKRMSQGHFGGYLYFNTYFQKHCLPHPEPADTWLTIFACEW